MLTFTDLYLYNFIKYRDQKIPLKNMGLVLLTGDNRDEPEKGKSGVGKTILGDAIHWVVSGNTTRKISANSVIGDYDKYAAVGLGIEHGNTKAIVSRYRNHPKHKNSVIIDEEGVDVAHRNVAPTEERIKGLLGCSFNLFRLSSFQNNDNEYRFSRMNSSVRAKILDEIIGTSEADVPKRLKKVNELKRENENELVRLISEKKHIEVSIDNLRGYIKTNQDMSVGVSQGFNDEVERRKKEIEELSTNNVSEIRKSIERLLIEKNEIEDNEKKARKLKEQKFILQSNRSRLRERINGIVAQANRITDTGNAEEGELCERCGNIASGKSLDKLIKKRTDEAKKILDTTISWKEDIESITKNIADVDKQIESIGMRISDEVFSKIRQLEAEEIRCNRNLEIGAQRKKELVRFIKENENSAAIREETLNKLQKKLLIEKKSIRKLQIFIAKVQLALDKIEILSDFYGPAGFRPLAMRQYSPILSKVSNDFLMEFTGGSEQIHVNSKTQLASGEVRDKVEIRVEQNGNMKSFPNEFCAGENGAIDLSMNFGIMKLAQMEAKRDFNFMYFDECTNGLSEKLVDKFIEVLRNKVYTTGMTIILTTHRPINSSLFDCVWVAVKEQGYCRIEFEK